MLPPRVLVLLVLLGTCLSLDPVGLLAEARVSVEDTFVRGLLSGAATRAAKELLLHPIDTVKTRLQLPGANRGSGGLLSDLYSGVVPAVVGGIPAGAVFFGVKDVCRRQLLDLGLGKAPATALAVSLANLPYWLVRCPAELLKTRQQASLSSFAELKAYVSKEGLSGVYASYPSNLLYALPADLLKFLAYDFFTGALYHAQPGSKVEGLDAAVAGALAGLVAQAATTPLDVARTRVMAGSGEQDANPFTRAAAVAREEGLAALFAGLQPRMLRAVASGAVQFASYELTQNMFR